MCVRYAEVTITAFRAMTVSTGRMALSYPFVAFVSYPTRDTFTIITGRILRGVRDALRTLTNVRTEAIEAYRMANAHIHLTVLTDPVLNAFTVMEMIKCR